MISLSIHDCVQDLPTNVIALADKENTRRFRAEDDLPRNDLALFDEEIIDNDVSHADSVIDHFGRTPMGDQRVLAGIPRLINGRLCSNDRAIFTTLSYISSIAEQ